MAVNERVIGTLVPAWLPPPLYNHGMNDGTGQPWVDGNGAGHRQQCPYWAPSPTGALQKEDVGRLGRGF